MSQLGFEPGDRIAIVLPRMRVRLVKKHARFINGIDLSGRDIGDTFELPLPQAQLLLAEQWAVAERRHRSDATTVRRRADDVATKNPRSR